MKVSKKSGVKSACEAKPIKINRKVNSTEDINDAEGIQELPESCVSIYGDACDNIMQAIKCLAENAENDEIARDAIANLSVVLLDLK